MASSIRSGPTAKAASTYNNGAAGSYDCQWSNVGNFVAGKGWNPGSAKVIKYNGTWNGANVNGCLSLYGWTENPLVEYYIVESFGSYNPSSGGTKKGTVTVDGGTYDIYLNRRAQPAVDQGHLHFRPVLVRTPIQACWRNRNHWNALRRLGQGRPEDGLPQLHDHGYRRLSQQWKRRHHNR